MVLNSDNVSDHVGDVKISYGISQHDIYKSAQLFCLAKHYVKYGYKMFDKTINHLVYMKKLKAFAKTDQQLQDLLARVK